MTRISRYGLMLLAVAALPMAPSAWATCAGVDTQIVGNTLGGHIDQCPDANPIEGWVWLLSNPAGANSGGQNFVCRSENEVIPDSIVDCTFAPGSGTAGDGVVTVYMEFGAQNATVPGCPNQTQSGNAGATPMGVQVICNNGASAMFQVGWSETQQFPIEFALPDDGLYVAHAGFGNAPTVTSVGAGPSPSASNVCVNVPLPTFNTDCTPGTFGNGISCSPGDVRPAPQRGTLLTTIGPCNQSAANPNAVGGPDLRIATWTPTTVQPDAAGNACNTFAPPTGQCAYIGVQSSFGGVASGGITGWTAVAGGGPNAATDKVKIDSATAAQGKVKVAFSTTNETAIVGFNVYSDGAKLNGSLITSKGVGNNDYAFEIGRGALKGGKSVLVEAVKKDGTVEKTAPVSLK